ncbi:MAG: hypothetical protein WA634_02780 [Silvibacterium sp.]
MIENVEASLRQAQNLMEQLATEAAEGADKVSGELLASVAKVRERLTDLEEKLKRDMKRSARAAEHYIQAHPWKTIGIAALASFLLGALLTRRD